VAPELASTSILSAPSEPDSIWARTIRYQPLADQPGVWQVGDVVLDLYEVKQIHESGGMGLVYRVHHKGWGIDLAVKSPRPQFFGNERAQEFFEREAETWVRLGLHPHTVSCYYVRRLQGIPRLFAEYVEGGSLAEWIHDGRLYQGGPEASLARIVDIAIQCAWGLHYAHEQGLIHQDVKPANILLTPGGVAKVTDFGLARALDPEGAGSKGAPAEMQGTRSLMVTAGGMTPAYCSPEQARRQRISRKTDIWSWGVSLLEMFAGEVTWQAGQAASEAFEAFLEAPPDDRRLPKMPPFVADLLRRVFQLKPQNRPRNMEVVVAVLRDGLAQATGTPYARPTPQAAVVLADSLNNRAVSFADLDKHAEAEKLWEQALQVEVEHPESTYNLGIYRWRTGKLDDEALVRQLRAVIASRAGEWLPAYLLAQVHVEREDYSAAIACLQEVDEADQARPEHQDLLQKAQQLLAGTLRPLRRFEGYGGHRADITSLALTRDVQLLVTGSKDHTLKLWEVNKGLCQRTLEGHADAVNAVCFSATGRHAVSGSSDRTLRLWDVADGSCLHVFEGHTDSVSSVCIDSDGIHALSGSADRTLKVWELSAGRCVQTLTGHEARITAVCFGLDRHWALSASDKDDNAAATEPSVRLWNLREGACQYIYRGHTERISALCVHPQASLALSGSWDKTLKVWDLSSEECVSTLTGHGARVTAVCFTPDGRRIVSGSDDGMKLVWDTHSGKCLREICAHGSGLTALAVSSDGGLVLTAGQDRTAKSWRLNNEGPAPSAVCRVTNTERAGAASRAFQEALRQARSALDQDQTARAARWLRKARSLPGHGRHAEAVEAWADLYTKLARKALNGAWESHVLQGHRASITAVDFSLDGRRLVSAARDRAVRIWDVQTGECERIIKGHEDTIYSVHVSRDGRNLLTASKDQTLKLWSLTSGKCLQTFQGHTGAVRACCLTSDQRFALSGGQDHTIKLWETSSGRCLRTMKGHRGAVASLNLSADERHLLSGAGDKMGMFWDIAGGRCLRRVAEEKAVITSVCLGDDASDALISSWENAFRLWDMGTGEPLRSFRGHTDRVTCVRYSADGQYALSGSWDRSMRLWKVATGRCLRVFEGHADKVNAVGFSADGRHAVSAGDDQEARLWVLDWELENNVPADWDQGARKHLANFLALHTPYAAEVPRLLTTQPRITRCLTRQGEPSWNRNDFEDLLHTLGCAGYGWLRPAGVRRQLERIAGRKQGTRADAAGDEEAPD
jgi:WD40 repeat protein/serine/threonine protein kinase